MGRTPWAGEGNSTSVVQEQTPVDLRNVVGQADSLRNDPHIGVVEIDGGYRAQRLRLRPSERRLILWAGDMVALCAALIIAVKLRSDLLDTPGALWAYWYWFVTLAIVWWFSAQLFEAYDLARAASGSHSILSAAGAAALAIFVYVWIPVLTPPLINRKLILVFALLAVGGIVLWRALYRLLVAQPTFHQHALIFGAGLAGQELVQTLADMPVFGNPYRGSGYELLGFVDDDQQKLRQGSVAGLPILGSSSDLPRLTQKLQVDEIVLAITERHTIQKSSFDALLSCRELGIPITTMPALYERLLGRVPVNHIGHDIDAVLPAEPGPTDKLFWALKRGMDILGALAGLLVMGFLIPPIWVANAIGNRGPLFYRQERLGQGGRLFTIVKLRSMLPDAERNTGAIWSAEDDPRITPVGRWLRKSRLDELPQFINVLKGEMSIIGPRPERPEFVRDLAQHIPFYRARHAVRPGLTGWAQVRYRYGNTVDDARVKLEYDLFYVRHAGLTLEMLILLRTAAVVLRLQGK